MNAFLVELSFSKPDCLLPYGLVFQFDFLEQIVDFGVNLLYGSFWNFFDGLIIFLLVGLNYVFDFLGEFLCLLFILVKAIRKLGNFFALGIAATGAVCRNSNFILFFEVPKFDFECFLIFKSLPQTIFQFLDLGILFTLVAI